MYRVSVIIPSYNSAAFVPEAVESALSQSQQPCEVIVIDDGSTDCTGERLSPYKGRIRYIRQLNGGLSNARNRGIREASGDLLAFLDADDVWLPNKLARQCDLFRKRPGLGLVHSDIIRWYPSEGREVRVEQGRSDFSGCCYPKFLWGNRATPSTVIVTRSCIDRVGMFDESIRGASTQDQDLWHRISRYYEIAYVAEPLVRYRFHGSNASHNLKMMVEDEYYVLAKALKDDPQVWGLLDREVFSRRISALAFEAGYMNLLAGSTVRARRYFRHAVSHDVRNWKAQLYRFAASLPPGAFNLVRSLKHQIGSTRSTSIRS